MSKTKPQQYSAERTEQLLHAAAEGDATLVEALLGAGAFINGTNYNLQTALIRAAFFGHVDVVKVLLDHGAESEAKDKLGLTAAEWAIKRGFPEVAQLLPGGQAAMATTMDGSAQPELAGATTLPDTEDWERGTSPEQSDGSGIILEGEPTQPLLYNALAREMHRRQANIDAIPATIADDPAMRLADPPTLEDLPAFAGPPTLEDPPTRRLSELPTQRLDDPPTRPLDKFATQLLDDPPTRQLGEFATQLLGEPATKPLSQLPSPQKSAELAPLPTTAPLMDGTTIDESASTSASERAPRTGRALTWVVVAVIAVAGALAAYLIYSRRQTQPVTQAAVSNKPQAPQGAFAGSEVSLQLGKGQPARSSEITTPNASTTSETSGPETYPQIKGTLKGSEISLPDLETPTAARRGWRRGLINVAVTVGGDGKVITARPLNGPWIWRQAAQAAAQKAQFKPQSDALLRSGTITYHYGPLGQS